MRLADFIDSNIPAIVDGAEEFAATLLPAAAHLDSEALRDHLPMILHAVSNDLRLTQSPDARRARSLGRAERVPGAPDTAAQTHALLRAKAGFDIEQLVAEYRALRASVLRLWLDTSEATGPEMADDVVRFNEAIDQAVAESVSFFSAEVERWRHIFLGVLGHDLRGPLNAILLTSELLTRMTGAAPLTRHAVRLIQSGKRMQTLLDDLLDFSRASLGLGIGIHRVQADLALACSEEVEVLRAALPDAGIAFEIEGNATGEFDASRVRELLGNLVTNASRYGEAGAAIKVKLTGDPQTVRLSVENTGTAIPEEELMELFEPLRRGRASETGDSRSNLGLGLFIVREIARAHGGEVQVTSSAGTTVFAVVLPRTAKV